MSEAQLAPGEAQADIENEVVVIGGGPVGLCASLALARKGFSVAVLEARRGSTLDKACGEGLMPDALEALRQVGVTLQEVGIPLRGIRYTDDKSTAAAAFPAGAGRGVRRLDLHHHLAQAVAAHPAIRVRHGCKAAVAQRRGAAATARAPVFDVVVQEPGSSAASHRLRPRWIVAADGLRSPSRAAVGLTAMTAPVSQRRFGARVHFAVAPWSDEVEVYWQSGQEAYVTPVGSAEVGLALLWDERHQLGRNDGAGRSKFAHRLASLWQRFPRLGERLAQAPRSSAVRGIGPLHQPARQVWRGNLALVGDASGYLDAITGEGLALGFADALDVASALQVGDLGLYARRHRQRRRVPIALIRATLAMSRSPRLRRAVLYAMQHEPRLFSRLLGLHVGAATPSPATLLAVLGLFLRGVLWARHPAAD